MKFKIKKRDVERFHKEHANWKLGVTLRTARRLAVNKEKELGRHYVNGVLTGLNPKLEQNPTLNRTNFQRAREYNSFKTGYLNGRNLARVLN